MLRTQPAPVATAPRRVPSLTVYGCEPDEAELFRALAPGAGVVPVLVGSPVLLVGDRIVPEPGTRCISIGHTSPVPAPMLRALARAGVEHIVTRSIGVDHVDLEAAAEVGIAVETAPYAPDGVADFTLLLLLAALRSTALRLSGDTLPGEARRGDRRPGARSAVTRDRELRDLTVGVVGVGRIGSAVIDRLQGFGCRILAHDPGGPSAPAEIVPLDALLRRSDVVTLHVPLTAATRNLLGARELATMKDGAVLVNTARGALVDTAALVAELESGRLTGAALDVVEGDPPLLRRLRELPGTITTPHIAYFTEGALRDTVRLSLERCLAFERTRVA